ncbi:MAG: DUF2259 domain-containing protein [Treponema sp.]|jgi:predicted secreted protein|nr:DUF2259 domain-containing protein [Treponema sp.]
MSGKKFLFAALLIGFSSASLLWAGDQATFVDLGFSPDGKTYMFGQYGLQAKTLRPWAEIFVVDVPRNDFVAGGELSYIHDSPASSGQDGSGAFFRLISRNAALADRYSISFLAQGRPLYLSLEEGSSSGGGTIEFRDFERNASYRAVLVSTVEGNGEGLKSSFRIDLEQRPDSGAAKTYTAGNPAVKRPLIASYRIRRVIAAPQHDSLIFVIETRKQTGEGYDIHYMVETLRI